MSLGLSTLHAPPEQMTRRARAYLVIATVRHLLLGVAFLSGPRLFTASAFDGIKIAMPGPASSDLLRWGLVFVCTGVLCGIAALLAREGIARWALLASIATTALLAGGFLYSNLHGSPAPTGLIGYVALVAKDLVVLRQPMRSPFEPLMRRVLADELRRR